MIARRVTQAVVLAMAFGAATTTRANETAGAPAGAAAGGGAAAAAAAATGTLRGRIVAEGASGPIVAYLEEVAAPTSSAAARARAQTPAPRSPQHARGRAVITQQDQEFLPGSAVVRRGARVLFPNKDKVFHNVFSVSPGNEFDLGLFRGGDGRAVRLRRPGEVDVYCNIHPNMAAKVLVVPNRFHAIADENGDYVIAGVPKGSHVLVAWAASHEPQRLSVSVSPGAETRVDVKLAPRAAAAGHLNKYGQPYGRYK